jgi:hypothetical protein
VRSVFFVALAAVACGGLSAAELGQLRAADVTGAMAVHREDPSTPAGALVKATYCPIHALALGRDAGVTDAGILCPAVSP